jgi:hypothetical protein
MTTRHDINVNFIADSNGNRHADLIRLPLSIYHGFLQYDRKRGGAAHPLVVPMLWHHFVIVIGLISLITSERENFFSVSAELVDIFQWAMASIAYP